MIMKLINKDALVAWLKERIREYWSDSENTMGIFPYALEEVIKHVDTLEVKEVDLEEEIDKIWNPRFNLGWDEKSLLSMNHEGFTTFAKHFYELGLKAKGE